MGQALDGTLDERWLRRLTLLAHAVCGAPVVVSAATGETSYSDGGELWVADSDARFVIAHAVLLCSGSFESDVLRKLRREGRGVVDRYLLLELARTLPGAADRLPRVLADELGACVGGVKRPASAMGSLQRARSIERLPAAPSWLGTLRPDLEAARRAGRRQPVDQVPDAQGAEEATEGEAEQAERSRVAELLSGLSNPLGNALQQLLGMRRTPGEGSGGQSGGSMVAVLTNGRGVGQRAVNGTPVRVVDRRRGVGLLYDEWDTRRQAYRPSWVRVAEFGLPAPVGDAPPVVGERRLRRQLARLLQSPGRRVSTSTGDDLHLTNLIDMRVSELAGHGGDWHVFSDRRRTDARFGVLVALDATSSGASEADGDEVFERQTRVVSALIGALDALGVRCSVAAFRSFGRQNVQWLAVKSFEEPWRAGPRRRLAALRPAGYTRLGAAIRHATQVAAGSGEPRNVVVVVTDGIAYDDGYEGGYAVADCRRAVEEADEARVAVVAVSVGGGQPDGGESDLAAWIPERFRLINDVDDVDDVAPVVVALLRQALRHVA